MFSRVPLTDEAVVFAPSRAVRKGGASCPFCPGSESQTRDEVAAYRNGGKTGDSTWRVRAFENMYPMVEAPHGAHEVIVDDRKHDVIISSESLQMYRDRFAHYEAQPPINAIVLFKNVGSVAGASVEHPHAQLVALGETPPRLRKIWANAWAHHRDEHECYWCALAGGKTIYANEAFAIVRPPVPRFAGEMLLIPKAHQQTFADLSDAGSVSFVDAFTAVQPQLGEDYNVLFFSPLRAGRNPALHWHVTLAPRCKRPAGFELATGLWVVEDEDSGRRLVM